MIIVFREFPGTGFAAAFGVYGNAPLVHGAVPAASTGNFNPGYGETAPAGSRPLPRGRLRHIPNTKPDPRELQRQYLLDPSKRPGTPKATPTRIAAKAPPFAFPEAFGFKQAAALAPPVRARAAAAQPAPKAELRFHKSFNFSGRSAAPSPVLPGLGSSMKE